LVLVLVRVNYIKMGVLYNDYPVNWSITFQDPATDYMYAITNLTDSIAYYLVLLLVVILWFLISSLTITIH
jgi:hypothetical protein